MSIHIYKYKYQTINFPPCVESPIKIQEKPFDPEESIPNCPISAGAFVIITDVSRERNIIFVWIDVDTITVFVGTIYKAL